jgi:transcriptional regulator with XRE-family HTH domain
MKGKELKLIRERLGLTQVELSKLVGVTSNTIARWERDEVSIGEPAARLIRNLSKGKRKG